MSWWSKDEDTHRAVSFREQRPFDGQHTRVDEALPGHEVQHPVHFLHAAHTHQPPDNNVQSTFLGSQHLLWKNRNCSLFWLFAVFGVIYSLFAGGEEFIFHVQNLERNMQCLQTAIGRRLQRTLQSLCQEASIRLRKAKYIVGSRENSGNS